MGLVIQNNRTPIFKKRLRRATAKGIRLAGVFLWKKAVIAVSVPNTGEERTRRGGGRDKQGRFLKGKGKTYTVYLNPSKPGEPPRLRKGHGRRNIVGEYNGNSRDPRYRVGIRKNAMYMAFLEVGTRWIKNRPWLMSTFRKFRNVIGKLAAVGGKGEIGR